MNSVLGQELRNTQFEVNRNDEEDSIRYRILAVILSSVPTETTFGRSDNNLDRQLARVLRNRTHPIITENFSIDPDYDSSPEVKELLSCSYGYGSSIGLENWGPDFHYRVTKRTHEVAEEIIGLGMFSQRDIKYLQRLGRKLTAINC